MMVARLRMADMTWTYSFLRGGSGCWRLCCRFPDSIPPDEQQEHPKDENGHGNEYHKKCRHVEFATCFRARRWINMVRCAGIVGIIPCAGVVCMVPWTRLIGIPADTVGLMANDARRSAMSHPLLSSEPGWAIIRGNHESEREEAVDAADGLEQRW
ncbi:uncharacterized protein BDZ99DRAFT_113541 [Mytilinidion resinicola]|uniref:Uncharacterized protein n=1 Tax=Mytilinidion resinicola TaxID=574789 RepID=A0A6A6Y992_9PEZI|nr:uncharacterized protein BDZ99DRAFT_113541 [Mytilinidion resinicola]KAF2805128.1 hypothetical protein BDZ99DRAFT_113541 [Mytilinidion resinicola]